MSENLKYAFKRRFLGLFSGPVEKCFINSRKSICHNITWNAASLSFHKSGFPGFLSSLLMPFWPSSNKGNTHGPTLRLVWPEALHRGPAVLQWGWLFTGHISAGLAFWLFPLLFLSLCASPIFMLKLTFELLPHCPPFFIANNYPWCFGSGGCSVLLI